MHRQKENLKFQKIVVAIAIALFAIKFFAFCITGSIAILTDALESTANILSGMISLYGLFIAAKPKDKDHPYGHGKAEYLSAAIEGFFICLAGIFILFEATRRLLEPGVVERLPEGMVLIIFAGIINSAAGWYAVKKGKTNNSPALIASGRHLLSDAYSTVGLVAGLVIIYFTGLYWVDSIVAYLFALFIIYTGFGIIKNSISGIMDEADMILLKKLVDHLNKNRRENWVDLHNLRVIKYGGHLHVDAHLTLPWYFNLNEAHEEIEELAEMVKEEVGESVEFFVHTDGCLYTQCNICMKQDCPVRKQNFQERINWNLDNLLTNKKHSLPKGR